MKSISGIDYWRLSRQTERGIIFVVPLWLTYESLAYYLNQGWLGSLRTGTDFILKGGLERLGLEPWMTVAIPAAILGAYLLFKPGRVQNLTKKPVVFAYMFLESLAYSVAFGALVGAFTGFLLSPELQEATRSRLSDLIVSIGSGAYEEFIFRLVLFTALVTFFKKFVFKNKYAIHGTSIVLSSLVFSYFHYLDVFGEPLLWPSFTFRFLAGVVFSVMLIFRGYGITAYTHSLYNVLLTFRH